jgi:hypothetical protein
MSKVLKMIDEVLDLYRNPKVWIKNTYAKDAAGLSVSCFDPEATYFCLIGAAFRVGKVTRSPIGSAAACTIDFLKELEKTIAFRHTGDADSLLNAARVSTWNDDPKRTYEEVIQVLKDTKERLSLGVSP